MSTAVLSGFVLSRVSVECVKRFPPCFNVQPLTLNYVLRRFARRSSTVCFCVKHIPSLLIIALAQPAMIIKLMWKRVTNSWTLINYITFRVDSILHQPNWIRKTEKVKMLFSNHIINENLISEIQLRVLHCQQNQFSQNFHNYHEICFIFSGKQKTVFNWKLNVTLSDTARSPHKVAPHMKTIIIN